MFSNGLRRGPSSNGVRDLQNGVYTTMRKAILDRGRSASEALYLSLAAVYGLIVKCLLLLVCTAETLGEFLARRWEDLHGSIQRVTSDLTELCRSWWEDTVAYIKLLVAATVVLVKNFTSLLADATNSTAAHTVPLLVEFRGHLDQRLGGRYQNIISNSIGPPVQLCRDGINKIVSDSQLLAGKLSKLNTSVLLSAYLAFVSIVWFILLLSENESIISGFSFGLLNGFGLMRFWAWMMTRRIQQRAETAASFASLLDETILRGQIKTEAEVESNLPPPSPISGGFEKVEWLNKMIMKVWPFLATVIEDHRPEIRDSVEAFMEEYRLRMFQVISEDEIEQKVQRYIPANETLTGFYFNDLSLGSTPPRIRGVKLRDMKDNKIVVDVRLEWDSNALDVTLAVGTSDGNLKVLLQDLQIKATLRIQIYFAEEPPFVSVLVLLTPAKPQPIIHYRLTPDQDALEHLHPVVMPQLEELIHMSVHDSLRWPSRVVITPTWAAKSVLNVDDLRLKPHGQLHVTILKGENLVNLYAYILLYIRVKFKVRTKSVENTPNPFWLEEFYLDAVDQESQILTMQLMNESKGKDELVGVVTYPLAKLDPDKDFELELPVQIPDGNSGKRDVGILMVILRYHVYTKEEQKAAMVAERKLEEALDAPEAPGSYATAVELLHG
ncbi:hypothetical protein R1sor_009912 [Riccia sorocarpa]|uniref:C2 domain-containing protein n=1 Tax=Riccia sorocarpa TaxID=122646 RepID=A0ABD3HXX1_9MARC